MRALLVFALALLAAPALAGPPASVRSLDQAPVRVAPHGKARVQALAQGNNAWIGRLTMDAGAKVPLHRDPTEEYVFVIAGSGQVTIDGRTSPVAPGTTIFMPANAEVTFQNGDDSMTVIQVFAGPGPAAKYDAWQPETKPAP